MTTVMIMEMKISHKIVPASDRIANWNILHFKPEIIDYFASILRNPLQLDVVRAPCVTQANDRFEKPITNAKEFFCPCE